MNTTATSSTRPPHPYDRQGHNVTQLVTYLGIRVQDSPLIPRSITKPPPSWPDIQGRICDCAHISRLQIAGIKRK